MGADGDDAREHTWIRVYGTQKMALEREALRLRRERFAREGDLGRVSMADTVAALLEELRSLRTLVCALQNEGHSSHTEKGAEAGANGNANGTPE